MGISVQFLIFKYELNYRNDIMTENIRVRFAPSPTGDVHIGNIRVCIYNWLFARHHKGTMLLRVEDTDAERNTPQAIETLFDALKWLELDFDEEPVFQSKRLERYREVAQYLLDSGHAYYSDKGARDKGEALIFKVEEDAEFTDLILGTMSKSAKDMTDFVIMKSDNTPVFHLANVIDDIDMNISHILRGNDHVENTFRHVLMYKALGKPVPLYAHFPMIVNAAGKPYSKRDGDAFVGDFKDKGYLAPALFNFLALCGWSPGDDREVLSREELIDLFDLKRVRSSPAQFNTKKMDWMNKEYIRMLSDKELCDMVLPEFDRAGLPFRELSQERKLQLVHIGRNGLRFAADLVPKVSFVFNPEYAYDEKGIRKFLSSQESIALLRNMHDIVRQAADLSDETLTPLFEELMKKYDVKFVKVAQPLRLALTGTTVSPGIFESLRYLGKEESLRRIQRTLELYGKDKE